VCVLADVSGSFVYQLLVLLVAFSVNLCHMCFKSLFYTDEPAVCQVIMKCVSTVLHVRDVLVICDTQIPMKLILL